MKPAGAYAQVAAGSSTISAAGPPGGSAAAMALTAHAGVRCLERTASVVRWALRMRSRFRSET